MNIMPFGTCTLGLECEQMIELEDLWENHEPQNMMVGEDEAITMKSTLTCKKSGMWIEPVSSGQDKKAAERILKEAALTYEMKQKYPGLLEILKDPYGSLYLHEGMCEKAIQFLEDSLKRNGDMEMASLYGEYDMEGMLIRSALGHLLVTCDVSRLELFVEGLSTRGVINGMEDTPGWDARLLNEEMLEMVRREYPETAKRVETKSYYKWQEEHKKALSVLGQMATEIAYGCMSYECMIATKPYTGAVESKKSFNKGEETANENAEIGNDAVGTESDTETVTYRRVQGGTGKQSSQQRVIIDENGNVYINKKYRDLNLSIDNGEHSQYYVENNRPGADIYEFEVPKWLDDMVQEYTIPQAGYKNNPLNQGGSAPKLTDPTTPGKCIEFPAPWIEWIEEYATNGRVISGG